MQLEAYQLVECIYEGRTTRVFRGVRRADAMKVIIKVHRSALPRPTDITSFHNHFNITRLISSERIVRPLAIEQHGNVLALISEDHGEMSLREELRNNPPTPARVMAIGIMLAQALEDLYAAQVIHKDVKPDNILVDPQSGVVRLGDFAISTLLPREAREAQRDTALSGTLAYISPEQTGRLHRWIDHRSDLYSLGVTLYELATGTLPFTASEPMEIIHAHLTRRPIRPSTVNRAIPPALCDIIMKLLAKAPGDRYQSPTGLRLDLEECLRQCREHGSAASFALGVHDSIERFGVPDELYGRASEVQQLLSTFDGVVKGESALMFVMGSSGIGKSALVRAIQEPILRHQGYFAAGKFDQYNRDIPFSSLVQAFRDLLRQILTEEHHRLTTYKSRLMAALGTEAGVVTDVIPEVELFIGSSSPIVELPPADNRERFIRTFKRFIHAFADPHHPLVVFLDDLQWADTATLELLVAIFEHEPPSAFLFMGAYRDNEVDLAHPLARAIDRLENRGVKMERIHLEPLGLDDVACLVAGALRCSPEEVRDMAQSILERTGGNPFYCTRYLQSLYDDGHLQFNRQARRFERKLGSLRDVEGRTDVVNFMLGRLERFAPETRDALKFAAAIGSRFSLETLAMLCDLPHSRVAEALWPALVEGLILPLDDAYRAFQGGSKSLATTNASMMGGAYRFLHDRIQ
ncbi:MAG TPA: AAA family ATPase, partial [Polyangium sp.]|nr:AAA family ATPase [Polyangium sp.]